MPATLDDLRDAVRRNTYCDEAGALADLKRLAALTPDERAAISAVGAALVKGVRAAPGTGIMESFLAEYGLSTREGVALMCLAEALLRVPDSETIDDLIRDKIAPHDWGAHVGDSGSLLVNASTWALMLTGRVLDEESEGIVGALRGLVRRMGEPVIRTAVGRAMKEMGAQFVLGEDIVAALKRGAAMVAKGYTYSFDMLGEAARTEADAARYLEAYSDAISALGAAAASDDLRENPGISVKLSALHPRYEYPQRAVMLPELVARTLKLAREAKAARVGFNIDAEEADRLDLSLDVIEGVLSDPTLAGWDGFGVVVQTYGRRAPFVIDWLHALAGRLDRRIMVRLVKGAYWDTEIKRAQVLGLPGYPVFTRKVNTDVSYVACARKLLAMPDRIYPQFATHNAHTVAAVLEMAGEDRDGFEFQRLHGMGEALHGLVKQADGTRCRIYAPVGAHRDLLAYLVRRLLENGANSSFVHQIVDADVPAEQIAADPFAAAGTANADLPVPAEIFEGRRNSVGWDITDPLVLAEIDRRGGQYRGGDAWQFSGGNLTGDVLEVQNPAAPGETVGRVRQAAVADCAGAVARAAEAAEGWGAMPVSERSAILLRIAGLFEANAPELFMLAMREAGKTLLDGVAEVREAVDFLNFYATEAARAETGVPRGVIVCISPWNFPLAIFTGQIAAALVTGNAVIAKPAEQTPLMASRAVELMHQAGVPADVLQLLPGPGETVGAALTADPRIGGVCFTGSTEVARLIERQLATTAAPDAMLIAETGGLNAMIVDSTALMEQAVRDILASAFQSAGQRCSALRMLYVQKDVENDLLEMLTGAMDSLQVGDPRELSTDLGPVIDAGARQAIADYVAWFDMRNDVLKLGAVPDAGNFVAPTLLRVAGIGDLEREVFGPVLHVAVFEADRLHDVVDDINATGYGLTFGLHTRIDGRVQEIVDRVHAGNIYVNRNQIGAVVGSQPFGGEGLSGTGPKAGGANYLARFRKPDIAAPVVIPATSRPAADVNAIASALRRLATADPPPREVMVATLRAALRGRAAEAMRAAAALDTGPIYLPGPTGELNSFWLPPVGIVVCTGPCARALLDQTVLALGCGNRVMAVAQDTHKILKQLREVGLPLACVDGTLRPHDLQELSEVIAVAMAADAPEAGDVRRALSRRDGAIAKLILTPAGPESFCHERALCIDTTAAGGNAALLAAQA